MKLPSIILIPMLLLALIVIYFGNRAPKPSESAERVQISRPNFADAKAKMNQKPEIQHFSWREVESEDYRQYVANLRRVNVPELTVVDIIVADVNRLFSERAKKLKADYKQFLEYKYWQVNSLGSPNRTEFLRVAAQLETLNRERVRLINDLLGKEIKDPLVLQKPDAFKNDPPASVYSVDFLPEPKRLAYNALMDAARAELNASVPPGATDERSMQLRKDLTEKYEAELVKMMSPAEKLEYDARYSLIGQRLRNNLAGMQPTQEEFLQIVALGQRYYAEYDIDSVFAKKDPLQIPDQQKAKREMETQLEQALGAERFQQLQRGLNFDYGRDTTFLAELGLNQDAANDFYRLREDLRTGAVLNQSSVLAEQKLQAAKAAAINLLGEEAYQRYINRPEGRWLSGLPNSLRPTIVVRSGFLIQENP